MLTRPSCLVTRRRRLQICISSRDMLPLRDFAQFILCVRTEQNVPSRTQAACGLAFCFQSFYSCRFPHVYFRPDLLNPQSSSLVTPIIFLTYAIFHDKQQLQCTYLAHKPLEGEYRSLSIRCMKLRRSVSFEPSAGPSCSVFLLPIARTDGICHIARETQTSEQNNTNMI